MLYPFFEIENELSQNPWRFENRRDKPMDENHIERLERLHRVSFCDSYKFHLMTYGAGEFGSSEVWSPDPNSEWSVLDDYLDLPDSTRRKAFIFSDANEWADPATDFYLFRRKEDVLLDEVVILDLLHPTDIRASSILTFKDFILHECIYVIPDSSQQT